MSTHNPHYSDSRGWRKAAAGVLLFTFSALAGMGAPSNARPEPAPANAHEMTAADLEAFLGGLMPVELGRMDIAGAVVLVVKDGHVLFTKGYGYSDVEKKTPVTPEGTLFRIGSVSKLFTWTAVMQLVEQGKLNLDSDVNNYLDFKIPATYPQPITMRNILTHTTGFEEMAKDMFSTTTATLVPVGGYLKARLPGRIFAPGSTNAYSNYGATLAGYIVERISGQSFDDYVEQHILWPLDMRHSTFRQPLPATLAPMMSHGYKVASAPAKPFEIIEVAAAGSAAMPAAEISHFMLAHLQDGAYGEARILRPETARLMHTRQQTNAEILNGMALGFYEESSHGHRIIGHAGDTEWFHSDLHLMLDTGIGFFVSYNSRGGSGERPREAVWQQFLDRYYPYDEPVGPTLTTAAADATAVSGKYIVSRRFETSIFRILNLFGQMKVFRNPDNTISVDAIRDLNRHPKRFREIAPLVFRDVNGDTRLAFSHEESGRLRMAGYFPFMVFQRAFWYQNSALGYLLIGVAVTVSLATLILWPIGFFTRRHYGRPFKLSPLLRKLRLAVRLVCAVDLIFTGTFFAIFMATETIDVASSRMDIWYHLLQLAGWIGLAGGLLVLWNAIASWRSGERGIWSKLGDTVNVVACVCFTWFVLSWNLLAWGLHY